MRFVPPFAGSYSIERHFHVQFANRVAIVLAPGNGIAAIEASISPEIPSLLRIAKVAPLMFEPRLTLDLVNAIDKRYAALHFHLRSGVVVSQPVHGLGILVIEFLEADALEPPIRAGDVPGSLDHGSDVHLVWLAINLALFRRG